MRAYTAYFGLLARMSLSKILLLIPLTAAADLALFWPAMERALARGEYRLETILDGSGLHFVLLAAAIAAYVILCGAGRERQLFGGREYLPQSFTLRRLDLSYRGRCLTQGCYKAGCLLLLWAAQVLILWGLCALYTLRAPAAAVSRQTIPLAFFQSQLLRQLLPMGAPLLWLRNLLLLAALGMDAAMFSMRGVALFYLCVPFISLRDYASMAEACLPPALLLLACVLLSLRKEVVYELPANAQNP